MATCTREQGCAGGRRKSIAPCHVPATPCPNPRALCTWKCMRIATAPFLSPCSPCSLSSPDFPSGALLILITAYQSILASLAVATQIYVHVWLGSVLLRRNSTFDPMTFYNTYYKYTPPNRN